VTSTRLSRMSFRLAAGTVALAGLLPLAACGGSSKSAAGSADTSSNGDVSGTSATFNACKAVTAAELSQATGVSYTAVTDPGGGTLCSVTAADGMRSFVFHVDKEDGTINTWDAQVQTIKQDDSSYVPVSGIGDKAVQGAIKEFAAEDKGYIVGIDNADLNDPATDKTFDHSKKVALLLISKLP
jgi:hypothetical protein